MSVQGRPEGGRGCRAAGGATLLIFGLAAAGCGGATPTDPSSPAPAPVSAPVSAPSVVVSSAVVTESATPSPTDTASPTGSPSAPTPTGSPVQNPSAPPATGSPDPAATGSPRVLDPSAVGRDLTAGDFFSVPVEWRDGRVAVATERDVLGVTGPIRRCAEDEGSAQTLELRLANSFQRLSVRIGQANDSESSDAELLVRVVGNGTFIDSRRVRFNRLDTLSVPVAGVNAVKIQVFMTGKRCSEDKGVTAVLANLRLE